MFFLFADRKPTPESRLYGEYMKKLEDHFKIAWSDYVRLFRNLKKRKSLDTKKIGQLRSVRDFLEQYLSSPRPYLQKDRFKRALNALRKALKANDVEKGKNTLQEIIGDSYKERVIVEEMGGSDLSFIPDQIRKFLPKNVIVEVDPAGRISEVTDFLEQEFETLAKKRRKMSVLVTRLKEMKRILARDMEMGTEAEQMAALITSIIVNTGIRPGGRPDSPTAGAVTLKPSHVRLLEDNVIGLEFVGKAKTVNHARIEDVNVYKLLKKYLDRINAAVSEGSPAPSLLFVMSDGSKFSYSRLKQYFKSRGFKEFATPKDFRRRMATLSILEGLKKRQEDILRQIREAVSEGVEDIKERTVEAISDAVEDAYSEAQRALSHKNVRTTIRSYINPEVLLRFLSQGKIEDRLEDSLLSEKPVLRFDPQLFIDLAMSNS